jgi:hypothetical protein
MEFYSYLQSDEVMFIVSNLMFPVCQNNNYQVLDDIPSIVNRLPSAKSLIGEGDGARVFPCCTSRSNNVWAVLPQAVSFRGQ